MAPWFHFMAMIVLAVTSGGASEAAGSADPAAAANATPCASVANAGGEDVMMMNRDDRIEYLLGDVGPTAWSDDYSKNHPELADVTEYTRSSLMATALKLPRHHLVRAVGYIYPVLGWLDWLRWLGKIPNDPQMRINYMDGDNRVHFYVPTLAKSRKICTGGHSGLTLRTEGNVRDRCNPNSPPNRAVLLPLNYHRHVQLAEVLVQHPDMPFGAKARRVVWRGSTTGGIAFEQARGAIVRRWEKTSVEWIDIGFHKLVQDVKWPAENVKEEVPFRELLKSQVLVMLEGNDVASGLPWALWSNSVVLMPIPTIETSMMHGRLVPWTHFIPMADDGSDLQQKAQWCFDHQIRCEAIAAHGTNFIRRFLSFSSHEDTARETLRRYIMAKAKYDKRHLQK